MRSTPTSRVLTPQRDDFPRWYQDVLEKAELVDNGPVRGTMVMRPYGYGIWERMQSEVDRRIKATGAENVYLPLLIPQSYLEREAEHVEGFSPELAIVTHAGGKELTEPAVIRPTSETVFGDVMSKWIQSHRDLPMLLNQWANVVRWELRPRLLLRTSEFLWQEGHTAHENGEEASAYARRILLEVYRDFLEDVLAIPVLAGVKTARERFAGAITTMTCEAMMGDGKALQAATSHELGQNFARALDITYTDADGHRQTCWTTSWGSTTRMLGGLVMAHGDDAGIIVPPRIAPIQVVVMTVNDDAEVNEAALRHHEALTAAGIRSRFDGRATSGFGRRATEWELKGIPIRVEVGPRDIGADAVTVVSRTEAGKRTVGSGRLIEAIESGLGEIQGAVRAAAARRQESRTVDVSTLRDAAAAARTGFARIPWREVGPTGEAALNREGVTVRCLQTADGGVPSRTDQEADLIAVAARSY